jgi:hypothetical protein
MGNMAALTPFPTPAELRANLLLASLPDAEQKRWMPHLELVEMPSGQVLVEPGAELAHAYFPITSIVSLLYVMENGASAEIAVVGREGLVGIALPRPATVPPAPAEPGPAAVERTGDDAGPDRGDARRAAGRCDRSSRAVAEGRPDQLSARPDEGLDRSGLERPACECYNVVRREYDRLLPAYAAP